MEISERDKRALKLGGLGLGIIAAYFLVVEPLISSYDGLVADHKVLAAKVKRVIYENRKTKYLIERIAECEEKSGELLPPKPYSEQITTVGDKITTAAQKTGVEMKNSTRTAAKPWPDDPTLEMALIHVDAQAGWENVFKFIGELYRIPGVLSVEQMNLSSGPKKGGKITLTLTVSVLVQASPEGKQGRQQWAG